MKMTAIAGVQRKGRYTKIVWADASLQNQSYNAPALCMYSRFLTKYLTLSDSDKHFSDIFILETLEKNGAV